MNQDQFISHLQQISDIATSDTLTTIKIEEERQFLIMQHNDVLSCIMAGIDVLLSSKEQRKIAWEQRQLKYAKKIASSTALEKDCNSYIQSSIILFRWRVPGFQYISGTSAKATKGQCPRSSWCDCSSGQSKPTWQRSYICCWNSWKGSWPWYQYHGIIQKLHQMFLLQKP